MRLGKLIWVCGLGLMMVNPCSARAQDARVIKNWRAHCGSSQCSTETDTTAGNVTLRLSRAATEGAPWHVAFRGLPEDLPPDTVLALGVDRSDLISIRPGRGLRSLDGLAYITRRDALDALFPLLRRGNDLGVTVIPAQGPKVQFAFSLGGVTATMLWIDERQDRVGQSAVVGAPEEAEPVALPLPVIIATAHKADGQCKEYRDKPLPDMIASGTLDEHRSLYVIPCWSRAYNVFFRVYVFDKRHPNEVKPELFATYGDRVGWFGIHHLVNANFDAKTKTLTAFEKFRALGDCGRLVEYRWADDVLRMTGFQHWSKCDGSKTPEDWPVIYRYGKTGSD